MSAAPPTCLFCQIARGQTPAARVLETETVIAFLDHRPLFPGHCLVIPREHVDTLGDLPGPLTGPLFEAAAAVARALEAGLGADGTFVAVNNRVSQSVLHLHVHVVPRRRGDGLRGFFWPRGRYESPAAMEETRARIAAALDGGALGTGA
ncbi:MAG TPA: HIT family protein [Methylomirabilota bacterium]|jgi:histidine triad (HIT) family protein|nr:HIT family protein [Methylomirabilota bacterium]